MYHFDFTIRAKFFFELLLSCFVAQACDDQCLIRIGCCKLIFMRIPWKLAHYHQKQAFGMSLHFWYSSLSLAMCASILSSQACFSLSNLLRISVGRPGEELRNLLTKFLFSSISILSYFLYFCFGKGATNGSLPLRKLDTVLFDMIDISSKLWSLKPHHYFKLLVTLRRKASGDMEERLVG